MRFNKFAMDIRHCALRFGSLLMLATICSCASKSDLDHVNDGLAEKDPKMAIRHYTKALEKNSRFDLALALRGAAWHALGDNETAMKDLNRAIEMAGEAEHLARNTRGIVRREQGDYRGAIEDHTRAIELNPQFAAAYAERAEAWMVLGEDGKSIDDYQRAVDLEPDDAPAQIGLASLYANARNHKLRDPEAAVRHARIACELTGFQSPLYLGILADAYREAGKSEAEEEYRAQAERLSAVALDEQE